MKTIPIRRCRKIFITPILCLLLLHRIAINNKVNHMELGSMVNLCL